MGNENRKNGALAAQIRNKIKNSSSYFDGCKSLILQHRISDNRTRLLIATTIIIETGMLNAYNQVGGDNTGAICDMYTDGKLNKEFQDVASAIRALRNDLVHLNVTTDISVKMSKAVVCSYSEDKFIEFLNDLFGEFDRLSIKDKKKLYSMITDSLGIDTLKDLFFL